MYRTNDGTDANSPGLPSCSRYVTVVIDTARAFLWQRFLWQRFLARLPSVQPARDSPRFPALATPG